MNKYKNYGQLIVISGPSGSGKGTIVKKLMDETDHNLWLSISCTSRKPRGKEKDGVEYYFLSEEEFEEKIQADEFLEYAKYADNYYGTLKSSIKEKLEKGIDVILEIEIQGALKIKEKLPETIFIFILPPTMRELKKRLETRNTETKDKILKRFQRAYSELNEITKYNYVVINDDIDLATKKIDSILLSEKCRVDRIEETYLSSLEEEIHEILREDKEFINEEIEI